MHFLRAIFVSAALLAGAWPARADPFTSSTHHFSATFPGKVTALPPEDNATDENDAVISKMTSYQDAVPGKYLAMVVVDTYITPFAIGADDYLPHNVKGFIDGIKGTSTQRVTTFEGHSAVQFAFDTPDHSLQGQGLLVFVAGDKPVGYLVIAARVPDSTPEDLGKLDAFITSFDIN